MGLPRKAEGARIQPKEEARRLTPAAVERQMTYPMQVAWPKIYWPVGEGCYLREQADLPEP